MNKSFLAFAVAALVSVGTYTSASAQSMYFVGAAGSGMASNSLKSDLDEVLRAGGFGNVQSSMGNGTAAKLAVGYEVSPNLAFEGGYFDSGSMTYNANPSGLAVSSDVRGTGFQLGLVGTAPVNDSFAVFGKVSLTAVTVKSTARVGTFNNSVSEDKSSTGYGVGAKYKLTEKVWLRGEWEQVASDVSALTIGLQVKF